MRILLVVHGYPPAASAGTEVYVCNLARALAATAGDDVRVFTREGDSCRAELSISERHDGAVRVTSVNNTFQSCATFEDSYANAAIEEIASTFLESWRPDVVHVQHLTCLSTGIPRQAARRAVPVVMTLNDYWPLCHRGQLADLNGDRCDGPFAGGCPRCIEPAALANEAALRAGRAIRSLSLPGAGVAVKIAGEVLGAAMPADRTRAASLARLRHMQAALQDVELFLAPSDTLAGKFKEFGIDPEKLVRCDQGIPLHAPRLTRRSDAGPVRLGFAGGLQPTKGLHVLLDALAQVPASSIVVDVFGSAGAYHGDDDYMLAMQRRLGHPAIRRLGPVPHDRMGAVLSGLDALVVPSVWIENAPFIIREAFAARLPVIASDLGGMAEMVRHDVDGLLFTPGNASALAAQLRRLTGERGLLERLRAGIVRPMSIEEDAARLRELYVRLCRGSVRLRADATGGRDATDVRLQADATGADGTGKADATGPLAAVVLNYRTPAQTRLAVRSLQAAHRKPDEIVIVDNASNDGSVELLRDAVPAARVIACDRNLGFSGGCNAGIRAALSSGAGYVLLVNSDAVLAPGAIDRLIAVMRADPRIGIAAPVLLSREEPDHIASAGISFSTRTGRMRHRGAGRRLASLAPGSVHVVDAVSGCVVLIRKAVFERAGLLDEAYFFSFEDVEFCLRARAAGFLTACVHDAVAYHEGGRTIGRRSARRVYFATRNHLRLAMQAGSTAGRPLRAGVVLGLNAAYVLVSPEAPLVGGVAALARGAWHHFTRRYGAD